jgi:hypothetical protein
MVDANIDCSATSSGVTLYNCDAYEDVATRVVLNYMPGVDGYDSAAQESSGDPARVWTITAQGIDYQAKYLIEEMSKTGSPVKFKSHPIMYDSGGDSATAAVKVIPMNPHFTSGRVGTSTRVWSVQMILVEVA